MSTIIITGSSSGIGKATAKYFQAKGWQVIATMRSPEKETELNQLSNVEVLALDVTNKEQVEEVAKQVINKYKKIDVIVNNAGFGVIGPFETATAEQIKSQFDTNLFGVMNVTRAFLPFLRAQKNGTFINISSVIGRIALPFYSLYLTSKWALEGYSEGMQLELASFGIKMRLVEPNVTSTDFFHRSLQTTDLEQIPEYKEHFVHANKGMDSMAEATPEKVAAVIYKAATSSSNKLRFAVGGNSKALLYLKKVLPQAIWYFIAKKVLVK